MMIIGIDPGVISTGYGVIEVAGGRAESLEYGMIKVARERALPDRLVDIYESIASICSRLHPQTLAIEDIFFNKNSRTAMTVGHVRGAVLLAAMHHGVRVYTYTPLQIKEVVTGYGRADKEQVQRMVKLILNMPQIPEPDHCADALAAAICHYYSARSINRLMGTGEKDDR
jgi:crossover junction endodeoxyribonuclease RuvC